MKHFVSISLSGIIQQKQMAPQMSMTYSNKDLFLSHDICLCMLTAVLQVTFILEAI